MKPSTSLIPMQMVSVTIKTDKFVYDLIFKAFKDPAVAAATAKEYDKRRRFEHLLVDALEQGWETFSWERAHEEGLLCENDYEIFDGARLAREAKP